MFFFPENAVKAAVNLAGGPTKVSNALGVSNAAVHKWIAGERVPDIDKARKLSELSNVALDRIRAT
jgi:DNA-binding transcriptional regulator YdaS (Cro superfamily)